MHDLPNVVLNVAVAGSFISQSEKVKKQIDRILYEMLTRSTDYQNAKFGFSSNGIRLNLYTSPEIADGNWLSFADNKEVFMNAIIPSRKDDEASLAYSSQASAIVNMQNVGNASVGNKSFITEWVAAQADLSIVLWDGNEEGQCADGWRLLQSCKSKEIPSIWIDVNEPKHTYWTLESYFEPFTMNKLKEYLASILGNEQEESESPAKNIAFSSIWKAVYSNFMRKYKAQIRPEPYVNDCLLMMDYPFEHGSKAANNHQKLVSYFQRHDLLSGVSSSNYNASLYFRAIVTLIITLFLAIGFYSETVFGYIFSSDSNILSYIAGIGFFLHALINFYVYTLSKNHEINSYKNQTLDNRFIAEFLRVSIHFTSFGIPVPFPEQIFSDGIPKKSDLFLRIRKIIRDTECVGVEYGQPISKEVLTNLELMIEDQVSYHATSQKRYKLIVERLQNFEKIFFFIGFFFILFRGLLQLSLVPFDLLQADKNFIKSAANMLALILPAWASYFTAKLSLCNFKGLLHSNDHMIEQLHSLKSTVVDLKNQGKPSYESIYGLSCDFYKLLTGDVRNWHAQMSSRSFTKI